ncbi:MAG TPA: hypothetical protein VKQ73_16335 [Stellaceae bacterium]|nr:hypothetical protein [Stellaceae bacterium]
MNGHEIKIAADKLDLPLSKYFDGDGIAILGSALCRRIEHLEAPDMRCNAVLLVLGAMSQIGIDLDHLDRPAIRVAPHRNGKNGHAAGGK